MLGVYCCMDGLRGQVVQPLQQTLASLERFQSSIEASKSTSLDQHGKLEQTVAQMIKDMQSDNAKHVDSSVDTLRNALRGQLDTMQSTQLSQRLEVESSISSKMGDFQSSFSSKMADFLGRMQQQSQDQVEKVNHTIEANIKEGLERACNSQMHSVKEFRTYMEGAAQGQQERHQDMTRMVTSVLEQACGAKSRAEECAQKLGSLDDRLTVPDDGFRDSYSILARDSTRDSECPPSPRNTNGSMQGRPLSAGVNGGSRRNSNGAPPQPSKYSRFGASVLNG